MGADDALGVANLGERRPTSSQGGLGIVLVGTHPVDLSRAGSLHQRADLLDVLQGPFGRIRQALLSQERVEVRDDVLLIEKSLAKLPDGASLFRREPAGHAGEQEVEGREIREAETVGPAAIQDFLPDLGNVFGALQALAAKDFGHGRLDVALGDGDREEIAGGKQLVELRLLGFGRSGALGDERFDFGGNHAGLLSSAR
ncbi:hypothetical protein D3C86_1582260 [compost metagenome]